MKLGKKPAREGAMKFAMSHYIKGDMLPVPPHKFGHQDDVKLPWGMLGNDRYGDCVWAGAAHETILWNAVAGRGVVFNDWNVLKDYSAVTGFSPYNSDSDQGTDMVEAASYRRKTGVVDDHGIRHKVAAYLSIRPGDTDQLKVAMYLFGLVGVGIKFPESAMTQFNQGKPWAVTSNGKIDGGHYIPMVGFDGRDFVCVTWGKLQRVTPGFLKRYMDEGVVYISEEMLKNGLTPEGFNLAQLRSDLLSLKLA